jgi:hypothetical protein
LGRSIGWSKCGLAARKVAKRFRCVTAELSSGKSFEVEVELKGRVQATDNLNLNLSHVEERESVNETRGGVNGPSFGTQLKVRGSEPLQLSTQRPLLSTAPRSHTTPPGIQRLRAKGSTYHFDLQLEVPVAFASASTRWKESYVIWHYFPSTNYN